MPREGFDHLLAERAVKAGARLLERTEAIEPVFVDGYVRGASVRPTGDRDAEPRHDPRALRARRRRRRQPVRKARRASAATRAGRWGSPRAATTASTTTRGRGSSRGWTCGTATCCCPGYGWLFPVAGGRINLGAGLLNTFANFKDVSAQQLFAAFARMLPPEWGIDEDTAEGRVLSGPLPMGMNRTPPAVPGMLLVGDAAGAVNPFNGEGIAYAMETGEIAAELVHEALVTRPAGARDAATRRCSATPTARYFAIGRRFAKVIGKPAIMGRATTHLLPHRRIMAFALRAMANLSDGRDGDLQDRMLRPRDPAREGGLRDGS